MMSLALLVALTVADPARGSWHAYLATPFPPADGFDPPHALDSALANGRVKYVDHASGAVAVEHLFYVNHERRYVRAVHLGLSPIDVEPGRVVQRGEKLGEGGARLELWRVDGDGLVLELEDVAAFTSAHHELWIPQHEPQLVIVEQELGEARYFEHGALVATYEVGFGQAEGRKTRRGDDKTPRGMYFVVEKTRVTSTDELDAYFGGYFIKLGYPNAFDAREGAAARLVTRKQAREIAERWRKRAMPPQNTRLGGGIGLHGWGYAWSPAVDGRRLSWGCIVMHNEDVAALYGVLREGAMVVLL